MAVWGGAELIYSVGATRLPVSGVAILVGCIRSEQSRGLLDEVGGRGGGGPILARSRFSLVRRSLGGPRNAEHKGHHHE
jgi:hypothetical protein